MDSPAQVTAHDDRHIPGLTLPRVLLRSVGVACLVLSALGLLYTLTMAVDVLTGYEWDPQTPFYLHFFIAYSTAAFVIQLLLLFCSHQLVTLRTNVRGLLLIVSVAIVLIVLGAGFLWTIEDRRVAMSAARATGVGLGGLTLYWMTAFLIWAPAITYWAHRRLGGLRKTRR